MLNKNNNEVNNMTMAISNNSYILKKGDLVKITKNIDFVSGLKIKQNQVHKILDIWNETNGNIVLNNIDPNFHFNFVIDPCDVDKIVNQKKGA